MIIMLRYTLMAFVEFLYVSGMQRLHFASAHNVLSFEAKGTGF